MIRTDIAVQDPEGQLAATSTERIHAILRSMSDQDWSELKGLMGRSLDPSTKDDDISLLERVFRRHEALAAQSGGAIFRVVQAIASRPALIEGARKCHERTRERLRFVLREMSDEDWGQFKARLESQLTQPTKREDIGVLELAFRIGESISNIEIAALAMADRQSGRRLIDPEVARRNALARAVGAGAAKADPQAAYLAAKQAIEEAQQMAKRAESTLAYRYVRPTTPYKHARNTIFKTIDYILESRELMAEAAKFEHQLRCVPPATREKMRWALHRMPVSDRMKVIKLIPLNTILMFHEELPWKTQDLEFKATRDRRLAYALFVQGQGDDQLMATYGLSFHAVKNAVGAILQALIERPLACQIVHAYLAQAERIEPMGLDEVRRRVRRLTPKQKAAILNGIPNCAWKSRNAMHLHKHLFLDYTTGEWVLAALVDYYNLEKHKRLGSTLRSEAALTVRGANAAIEGVLRKIAQEPDLRSNLRQWTSAASMAGPAYGETEAAEEPTVDEVMPRHWREVLQDRFAENAFSS